VVELRLVVGMGRWGAAGCDERLGGRLTRIKRVIDQSGFSTRRPAEKGDWVPGDCQQRRGRTWEAPDSSNEESGSLANVATRNVLGCFSISIRRFTLACSSYKRHLHELR